MTDAIDSLNFCFPVVLKPKLGMECRTVEVLDHTHLGTLTW